MRSAPRVLRRCDTYPWRRFSAERGRSPFQSASISRPAARARFACSSSRPSRAACLPTGRPLRASSGPSTANSIGFSQRTAGFQPRSRCVRQLFGMEPRPRVLVAHGLAATRLGIRLGLERGGFVICAECVRREGTVAAATRAQPDVCLVDARLPGGATATVRALTGRLAGTPVVVLGDIRDRAGFLAALRAGARGYVSEAVDSQALARTLR